MRTARSILFTIIATSLIAGCASAVGSQNVASATTDVKPVARPGFLGAFFRAQGPPPFGVFSLYSKNLAPEPYPNPSKTLFGKGGYCDEISADGQSISSGYLVDSAKLADIIDLGVRWTRTSAPPFFDDHSHVTGQTPYTYSDFDSAQCALVRHKITPLIALEAGPVQYDVIPGQFSPKSAPRYKSPEDFGRWCGVVAKHERDIFTTVHRYSLPGNEVNSGSEVFPPGDDRNVARYSAACYKAVKAIDPKAYLYGFELNMDRAAEPVAYVQRLYALGCKPGTCYDGLSLHLSLRYPIPAPPTPCYPQPGGDYSMQCVADIQHAAHAPIHVIIGETVYTVPGSVRDENIKATAVVAALETFARNPAVDGVNYANIDECDLYPDGYFVGGCLVDSIGKRLPAYDALRKLATSSY